MSATRNSLSPEFLRLVKLAQSAPSKAAQGLEVVERTDRAAPSSQRYLEGSVAAMIRTAADDHSGARREWLALANDSEPAQRLYQVALTYAAEGKWATARRFLSRARKAISRRTAKHVAKAIGHGIGQVAEPGDGNERGGRS